MLFRSSSSLMTGQYRYYDGLVHYLAMLHLCNSFKIWKPTPEIEEKTISGIDKIVYQGVTYTESASVMAFEDCKLHNVTLEVKSTTGLDSETKNPEVTLIPNPATNYFIVENAGTIESIILINMTGQVVYSQHGNKVNKISLPVGTYVVHIYNTDGNCYVKKLFVK